MSLLRRLPPIIRKIGKRWGKYKLDTEGQPLRDELGNKVLDPAGITTHSLRASMATAAGEAGLPIESVMVLGNWKSRRVAEGYRRTTSQQMIAAAAAMASVVKPKGWEPAAAEQVDCGTIAEQ